MSIVFFEGFNHNNGDVKKLDSNYWSPSNNSSISFGNARTGNGVYIAPTPFTSGTNFKNKLDLVNFTSPLTDNNSFGLGFYIGGVYGDQVNSPMSEGIENFLAMYNGSDEVLKVTIATTTFVSTSPSGSIGLRISQNGNTVDTFDFRSVTGYTYVPQNSNRFNGSAFGTFNWVENLYLEFYVDSKNTNTLRIRVNGIDMVNSSSNTTIPISGFNNITKMFFYGNNEVFGNAVYDDLYLTGGSSIDDTLMGNNTKIYRLNPNSNSSTMEWGNTTYDSEPYYSPGHGAFSDVATNDGDYSYIYTAVQNNQALFNFQDLPGNIPSGVGVGGIKVLNTSRKGLQNGSFTNVYASGEGNSISTTGPEFNLTSTIYNSYNHFLFQNPQTSGDWTISDINNMQLGVKKL